MKSAEIREKFLKYFESKGHRILPSSSLVPADPTVLLTLAGMLQFKPVFLGQEKPQYKRATTVQKCVRTIDIDQVGKTARHHTFFEMLGNFSFGDYFKKEAIEYAWELLVDVFKLPQAKLLIAVYEKDDEAYDLWHQRIGIPADKIFRLGEDNNFWAVGPTGPCGPCSEIYYDLGPEKGCGKPGCQPGCDCDRFLEVWNLVFIQFNRNEKGELVPLKQKGIDTGMGLERISAVIQGVASNFETDLFVPLIEKVKKISGKSSPAPLSLRIIADHARAVTLMISDGIIPENTGRGYILRRLIRRAVRHGKLIGIDEPFIYELANEIINQLKGIYPALAEKNKIIAKVIKTEEVNFLLTLEQGISLFKEVMVDHIVDKIIPGEVVFQLHDTYGFPIELSREIAQEEGFKLDEQGFAAEMERQKERARSAGISEEKRKLGSLDLSQFKATRFEGYDKPSLETKVVAVFPEEKFVILEKTPFYGESGGQIGDTGIISFNKHEARVIDTLSTPGGTIIHEVDGPAGLKAGQKVKLTIDAAKRKATEIHHTATHLLHQALKAVLGEHVKQAGSYVGPDKLRFDFTHFAALTPKQIEEVELIVNQKVKEQLKVEVLNKSYKDAMKMGAVALFGEKYGDKVRVLKIGDYSLELCGGTHIKSTAEIKFFKIVSEGALGSGTRRIEAVGGEAAKIYITYRIKSLCSEIEQLISKYTLLEKEKEKLGGKRFAETNIFEIDNTELDRVIQSFEKQDLINVNKFLNHLHGRLDWLRERIAKTEKEIKNLKVANIDKDAAKYLERIKQLGGIKVLAEEFQGVSMDMLRAISDLVQREAKSCLQVLASVFPDKVIFIITLTNDLLDRGFSAKKIAAVFSSVINGKAGGKDNKVEGGGKEPAKVKEALARVAELIEKK